MPSSQQHLNIIHAQLELLKELEESTEQAFLAVQKKVTAMGINRTMQSDQEERYKRLITMLEELVLEEGGWHTVSCTDLEDEERLVGVEVLDDDDGDTVGDGTDDGTRDRRGEEDVSAVSTDGN